ncbi:LCP family protein [Petrocella sp. FN5]|uniref:LCP family protein n=1 Tax=Petrocella sp. FN5 TaxID=3032002 RepID=UPI0023DC4A2C|nr:LCP family protein [Petrocella sp. FN5]MDF1615951.1 LCP family protein [Petrocella sp. FN5]
MDKFSNHMGLLLGITLGIIAMSFIAVIEMKGEERIAEEQARIELEAQKMRDQDQLDAEREAEEAENTIPESINGLFIGFDTSGGLTDVLMVGHIDPKENKVQLISIPRDLEIYFDEEPFKTIKKNNPKNRIIHAKLTEIYSLIGWDERALEDIRLIVEGITGLKIDYIMTIDSSGLREVVDAVGGVEFDVPQRMYYSDPVQDLYIDLQPGPQLLDGDKAEQLVRYRKYRMGDLQRIQVQQAFIAAMVDQVLGSGDFNQISQLISKGYKYIDTDFGMVVMLKYAEFFFNLELEHVLSPENMMTIPSYGEMVDERWFQYYDLEEAREAVDALIHNSTTADDL